MPENAIRIQRIGSEQRAGLYDLRHRVLRAGQPAETAHLPGDDDPNTIHLGAFTEDRRCVGVATLLFEADGSIRLRGMAVEPSLQGSGIGAALVRAAQRIAVDSARNLWCHARRSAVGFYEKTGWTTEGDFFDVPIIGPHIRMRWTPAVTNLTK